MCTPGIPHCTRGRTVTGRHVICELHCRRVWAQVASDAPAQSLMAPLLRPMLRDLSSAPSSTGTLQSTHAVKGTTASPYVGKSTPVYMYRLGMCLIQMVLVQCKGHAVLSVPAMSCWPRRLLETVVPGPLCPVSASQHASPSHAIVRCWHACAAWRLHAAEVRRCCRLTGSGGETEPGTGEYKGQSMLTSQPSACSLPSRVPSHESSPDSPLQSHRYVSPSALWSLQESERDSAHAHMGYRKPCANLCKPLHGLIN